MQGRAVGGASGANQSSLRGPGGMRGDMLLHPLLPCVAACCSVLQRVAVLQCGAVWCSVVQFVAVCCSVMQCVAVWCSVLQRVAV